MANKKMFFQTQVSKKVPLSIAKWGWNNEHWEFMFSFSEQDFMESVDNFLKGMAI